MFGYIPDCNCDEQRESCVSATSGRFLEDMFSRRYLNMNKTLTILRLFYNKIISFITI